MGTNKKCTLVRSYWYKSDKRVYTAWKPCSQKASRADLCSLHPNTKACAGEALTTWLVCGLHLARAVLPAISPIVGHSNTTGFVNHTPTILYWETDLYMQKFWPETPNLWQIHVCFPAGLFTRANGWNFTQESLCWVQQFTSHVLSASIAQAFVFGYRKHRF